jgi:hypothetical protein
VDVRIRLIGLGGAIVGLVFFLAAAFLVSQAAVNPSLHDKPQIQIPLLITGGVVAIIAAVAVLVSVVGLAGARIPAPGDLFGLIVLSLLSFLLPAAAVAVSVVTIGTVNRQLLTEPQVQISIALIASVLALLGGLSFIVIVLSHLGLTSSSYALGMPEGSIRAVLAISLLFLFMILSVFLYANLSATGASSEAHATALDIAKQLVTTVATLAVSVAGFYFGTASVMAATRAVAPGAQPTLSLISPESPQALSLTPGTELKGIRLASDPQGKALTWKITGDDDGQLFRTKPNVFTYRRGSKASSNVALDFALQSDPDVTARLEVVPPTDGDKKDVPPANGRKPVVPPAKADDKAAPPKIGE